MIKANLDKHHDVIKEPCNLVQTHLGNILDAQDYIGTWHLAVIVDENNSPKEERLIHFLPFLNRKRDELFTEEDSFKVAPAFTHTNGSSSDPDRDIATLRSYFASNT